MVIASVVLLIPLIAINVVNRVHSEVPPPLWTDDTFPMPAEEDNGFLLFRHYHSTTISGIDLEPIDNLLSASRDNPLPELHRLFLPARSVAAKIRPHTALCTRAFERERMVVPCLSLDKDACTIEPVQICTRLVTFSALDEASRGSARGVQRMATVLRRLRDVCANSPHPWIQARALLLLRAAIHHAAAVIKWRRGNTRALRDEVAAITEDTVPLMSHIKGTYLLKHLALRQALDRTDTWLLDEGEVIRGLNAPFEVAMSGGDLPRPVEHREGLFWWFDNAVGKKMLDAVRPGADDDFLRTAEIRETLFERRKETLRLK